MIWACSRASARAISAANLCRAPRRASWVKAGHLTARSPPGTSGAAWTRCPSSTDLQLVTRESSDEQTPFPGIRIPDRRAGVEDRRAALRAERVGGRHLGRDRPARQEEPAAHEGHLHPAEPLA